MTLSSISSTLDLMAGVQVQQAHGRDVIRRRREVGERLGLSLGETVGSLTSVASTHIHAGTFSLSNNARRVAGPNFGERRLPEFTVFRAQASRHS